MCYNRGLVRDKPLGAPVYVKLVSWQYSWYDNFFGYQQEIY